MLGCASASPASVVDAGREPDEVPESVLMMEKATHPTGENAGPTTSESEPGTAGRLDQDEIQKVINANIAQIQRCYEKALLATPGLAGRVQFEWVIRKNGSVGNLSSLPSDLPEQQIQCMTKRIRSWRFPKRSGSSVKMSYPFIFKSVGF